MCVCLLAWLAITFNSAHFITAFKPAPCGFSLAIAAAILVWDPKKGETTKKKKEKKRNPQKRDQSTADLKYNSLG